MSQDALNAAVAASHAASSASTATYTGAATAVAGALSRSEIIGFGGLAVAVISLLVQWYYRHKEFKLRVSEMTRASGQGTPK